MPLRPEIKEALKENGMALLGLMQGVMTLAMWLGGIAAAAITVYIFTGAILRWLGLPH